ncbi:acyl-CoA dehydrogenase NM domain-like protein [Roridomyces roridus]|uniref:Acyl-CoA dehydrogenase NM domain-like protein n=1 Tax=Roridomyces roridus TaxID=1738132 RepID=A0AAD7BG24_9AGAR|nr:acyl-CoA dehydrogenase NM domain-like protein [Roridomyces roridus]
MRVEQVFHQQPPPTGNPYLTDPVLPSLLKRLLPSSAFETIEPDLIRLGDELVTTIRPLAPLVKEPTLTQYDAWGNRVDVLQVSEGWKTLKTFACKEGVISIPYTRKFQEHNRVYAFAKLLLMTGDCHVIMCPYGMTDGAARVMELSGSEKMKEEILPRLISPDPEKAYISGQWMTESSGGSDVSGIETLARPVDPQPGDLGPAYLIDGFKWFSSAAEGNMSVALARSESHHGTGGLSLFLVPVRLPPFPTPLSNNILLHRLKNKVGTKAVPTAELSLNGARAWLIGPAGSGVRQIVPVLNITRMHCAVGAVGGLTRCLSLARAYAGVRAVDGGKLLSGVPAHMETLARVSVLYRALVHLVFGVVVLLGRAECGVASPAEEGRLRLLTPATKAFAALTTVPAMEECMAALGGQGYMEEMGMGRLIRDVLVERIWEGTVDVLAHDLIRASRVKGVIEDFCQWGQNTIASARPKTPGLPRLNYALSQLPSFFRKTYNPLMGRPLLSLFAQVAAGVFLLEHAIWAASSGGTDEAAFARWVAEGGIEVSLAELAALDGLGAEGVQERIRVNSEMVAVPEKAKL